MLMNLQPGLVPFYCSSSVLSLGGAVSIGRNAVWKNAVHIPVFVPVLICCGWFCVRPTRS